MGGCQKKAGRDVRKKWGEVKKKHPPLFKCLILPWIFCCSFKIKVIPDKSDNKIIIQIKSRFALPVEFDLVLEEAAVEVKVQIARLQSTFGLHIVKPHKVSEAGGDFSGWGGRENKYVMMK